MDRKFLTLGDLHYKVGNSDFTSKMEKSYLKLVKTENYLFVVQLGDVLDSHSRAEMGQFRRAEKFFDKLRKILPVYMLIGNHDRKNNQVFLDNEHFFNSWKGKDNLYIVDEGMIKDIQGKKYLFVPFVPDGRFEEAVSLICEREGFSGNKFDYTFAHQEFEGCEYNGVISTKGDPYNEKYGLVISGHIHMHQVLQNGKITYVGTPYQITQGETEKKTVSEFTISDVFLEKRINLGIPRKCTINKISCKELKKYEFEEDVEYRVFVMDTEENIEKFKKKDFYLTIKEEMTIEFHPIDGKKIVKADKRTFDQIVMNELGGNEEYIEEYKKILRILN